MKRSSKTMEYSSSSSSSSHSLLEAEELGRRVLAADLLSLLPQGDGMRRHLFLVKKLSQNVILPSRASSLSACYDLSSAATVVVPARGKALVPTDLSIAIPDGTYARIGNTTAPPVRWNAHVEGLLTDNNLEMLMW